MSEILEMAIRAKDAKRYMADMSPTLRQAGLVAIADALERHSDDIVAANLMDMVAGKKIGLTNALLDRLMLDGGRIGDIAQSVRDIAALP
ncbi:MAG: gamma-glutamyl-phosphate reductase, partial [Clostridiales bacterium]